MLENVGSMIVAGLAIDGGEHAAQAAAESAAARAGSVEHELDVVDMPEPSALWSPRNPHLEELDALEDGQAQIVKALLAQRDTELERILAALRETSVQFYVQPYWMLAGDTRLMRQFPDLPNGYGWTLDAFIVWTDPAAAADATVLVQIDGIVAVPMRLVATRNNPTEIKIGLPVARTSANSFSFTPAAGGGGGATDRIAVLARFKRGT